MKNRKWDFILDVDFLKRSTCLQNKILPAENDYNKEYPTGSRVQRLRNTTTIFPEDY
jgi:hypothetical protein